MHATDPFVVYCDIEDRGLVGDFDLCDGRPMRLHCLVALAPKIVPDFAWFDRYRGDTQVMRMHFFKEYRPPASPAGVAPGRSWSGRVARAACRRSTARECAPRDRSRQPRRGLT